MIWAQSPIQQRCTVKWMQASTNVHAGPWHHSSTEILSQRQMVWELRQVELVKPTPNQQQKSFPVHDNGCTLLQHHFPWNRLNFWLGLRRNCYWHSKHRLLSELNRGNWDIEANCTTLVSVLQEHCRILVGNSKVCSLSEQSLISANYQSFLKLLAFSVFSPNRKHYFSHVPENKLIYYFMEKDVKLSQLRDHDLIAWLETGMKTKSWWPFHWRF